MKYVANPVVVTAVKIVEVSEHALAGGNREVYVEGPEGHGVPKELTKEQLARYTPVAGDYVVTADDGYEYVNPKDVFEKKYKLSDDQSAPPAPPPVDNAHVEEGAEQFGDEGDDSLGEIAVDEPAEEEGKSNG